MAIRRKQALKRLNGLSRSIEEHLGYIASDPESDALPHWQDEIRNWLQQMEELLPHVGKKTSAQWEDVIQAYRAALES